MLVYFFLSIFYFFLSLPPPVFFLFFSRDLFSPALFSSVRFRCSSILSSLSLLPGVCAASGGASERTIGSYARTLSPSRTDSPRRKKRACTSLTTRKTYSSGFCLKGKLVRDGKSFCHIFFFFFFFSQFSGVYMNLCSLTERRENREKREEREEKRRGKKKEEKRRSTSVDRVARGGQVIAEIYDFIKQRVDNPVSGRRIDHRSAASGTVAFPYFFVRR